MDNVKDNTMQFDHLENPPGEAADRGQALFERERQQSPIEAFKEHWRALLACSVAFTGAMTFGFDLVVNGASISMPAFMLKFGEVDSTGTLYLPSLWTSLWVASSSLAQAISSAIAGSLGDRFGRTRVAALASIFTLIGTAVQYTANTRESLLGGKIITGFGLGPIFAMGIAYASEIAPIPIRNRFQQVIVIFVLFMQCLCLGIVRAFVPDMSEQAFRNVFALQWIVGGLTTIGFLLVPESPLFFVMRGRVDAARRSMCRIYGAHNQIDDRLAFLMRTVREEHSSDTLGSGSYAECFRGHELKRTLTVILLYTAPNWLGAAFLSQSIYFLITAGLEAINAFDVSIGGFVLAIFIIFATWLIQSKVSGRNIYLVGCIINFFMMLIIGALYYGQSTASVWAIAILMNLLISIQSSWVQAISWALAAEISSLRLRGKTSAIAVTSQTITTWFTTFTVPYIYNVDSGNLGARTGFIFMVVSVIVIVLSIYAVPDMAGLSPEEIDRLYAAKVPAWKFQAEATRAAQADMGLKGEDL